MSTSERQEDLLALRSLSSLQPRHTFARSLAAIESLGPAESSRFLDALRMRSLVARRLAEVAAPSRAVRACGEALSAQVARVRRMHEVLETNLRQLDQMATRLGVGIFGGKGISAHATYADRSVRDFNDVDIFVRSRRDAAAVSRALQQELGYRYQTRELPWFKLDPSDGLLYGQINLTAPADNPGLLNIDIHFGDYSVRHCGRLGITDTLRAGSPGLHMVAAEENLGCIVNNAAGDYFVTAKDTNDVLMALSLPDFDLDRLTRTLRRSHLDGFFSFIAQTLRASTTLTPDQDRRLSALPAPRTLEPSPLPDRADWNRRCIGTTLHAFAVRRPVGLADAVRVAANAFSYYRRRLTLTLAPGGRRPGGEPIPYNPWTCIRLVPLDVALGLLDAPSAAGRPEARPPESRSLVADDPDFERFDTPAGTYFRVDGELFVATVRYVLDAGVIRQAAAAATTLSR